jgi:hypothetical protein
MTGVVKHMNLNLNTLFKTLTPNNNKTCRLIGLQTEVSNLVGGLCSLSQPPITS